MLHTTGPRPGLSFSEAWFALDELDPEVVVVDRPTQPLRAGDLLVQLHRRRVSPQLVGTYLTLAGLPLPEVCRCAHPPADHDGPCARPGCGCSGWRTA